MIIIFTARLWCLHFIELVIADVLMLTLFPPLQRYIFQINHQ